MSILILGLIIFFATHLVPSFTLKNKLISRFGKSGYMGLFSLFAIIGLSLIVYGKGSALFIPLWNPAPWSRWIPILAMLPAFILLAWAYLPCKMKRMLNHPMLLGIILFSASHLGANGDLGSLLLFGSFMLFAILEIVIINKRSSKYTTSHHSVIWDFVGLMIGIGAYGIILINHQLFTGVPVLN